MMSQKSTNQHAGKKPVIVLTGGGTGGHITPLLSLARAVKVQNPLARVVYIGNKSDDFGALADLFDDFDEILQIPGGKFRRYHGESLLSHIMDFKTLAQNIRDFFKFIHSVFMSLRVLKRVKPSVVFSKGGFVALPVGLAAHYRHIPIVTHDSDAVPGLANRVLGHFTAVHAVGMPAGIVGNQRAIYTGNLIRNDIDQVSGKDKTEFKKSLGFSKDSLVLLVAGGSSGARDINNVIVQIAPKLLKAINNLKILHITGRDNFTEVEHKYKSTLNPDLLKRLKLYDFVNNFNELSGAADLVISRAGANSIAELSTQGKACIFIPNPALAGGHQLKNVADLEKNGAVEVVANNTTPENLLKVTIDLLENKQRRDDLESRFYSTKHKMAANQLAEILLSFSDKN